MRNVLIVIVMIILGGLALALGAQNNQLVRVNFLFVQSDLYLSTLLALGFLAGLLCASLGWGWRFFRLRFRQQRMQKTLQRQSQELSSLRAQIGKE